MVPAVAVNVAIALPALTATDPGTANAPELLDNATVAPPVFDTVTVQVALPFDPRLAGLQLRPSKATGATNEICAVLVVPFSVAVTVAV